MTRSRLAVLALALAVAGAACDTEPFGPEDLGLTGDSLDVLMAQASGEGGSERAGGGGVALFDDLAAQVPGFGGLYRRGQCQIVAVLTPEVDEQEALRIIHRVLTPIVARSCGGDFDLAAQEGQFTYLELSRYLAAAAPLRALDGVHQVRIDFQANRLEIQVTTRRVARVVLDRLDGLGIPGDAVVVVVVGRG